MNTKDISLADIHVMILAAGEGTRLRPLTFRIPKPLTPVINKPVMEHTFENLARQGIKHVMMNISYRPEAIRDYFGNGKKWGLKLHYSFEKKALGTAGGVKNVEYFFKNTFVVLSGDGLTNIDIQKIVDFHKVKKALGTMVVSDVDMQYEYGVVLSDGRGRIKKFLEKPKWSEVFSSCVNTGIYVFEPEVFRYIPKKTFYDFGCQLWPDLLKKNKIIYAYNARDYWCDIGDLSIYRQAHKDAMDGRILLDIPGKETHKNVWVGEGTRIEDAVVLIPPVIIGSHCIVEREARIGPYACIGNASRIGNKAHIQNTILWNKVKIDKKITLLNCIVTHDVAISSKYGLYLKDAVITVKD